MAFSHERWSCCDDVMSRMEERFILKSPPQCSATASWGQTLLPLKQAMAIILVSAHGGGAVAVYSSKIDFFDCTISSNLAVSQACMFN